MPDASGRFKGQGWSRAKEDSWTRIFGPALADDPAYEVDARAELERGVANQDRALGEAMKSWRQ